MDAAVGTRSVPRLALALAVRDCEGEGVGLRPCAIGLYGDCSALRQAVGSLVPIPVGAGPRATDREDRAARDRPVVQDQITVSVARQRGDLEIRAYEPGVRVRL